jgi:hypothetical protein
MMEKLAQSGEGGGCTPTLLHYSYQCNAVVVQCNVLAERAYTLPLVHLYPYILCGPGKGFLPYQTGLYTFSLLFVLNVFNVGHPVEAQLYSGLCR